MFGNSSSRSQNKNLVEFKAGKMTMKGKMVHPDKRKGLLYVYQSEESLMHFCWKDRQTGTIEDVSLKKKNLTVLMLKYFVLCEPNLYELYGSAVTLQIFHPISVCRISSFSLTIVSSNV